MKITFNQVTQILMILLLCGLLVYAVTIFKFIKSDSYACLNNPFTYSAKYTKENSGADLMCSCTLNHPTTFYLPFKYNINGTEAIGGQEDGRYAEDINLTNFVIEK